MFYIFDLDIPREEALKYYAGVARQVSAVARSGQRVVFPAAIPRRFVGEEGVSGSFRLWANGQGRLERFERIA